MRSSSTATALLASAAAVLLASSASAQGQTASVDSATSYCFFLPPVLGGDIAANEDAAIAFCNQANPKAPGAKIFPAGFVTSVHWATGDGWVQITGQIEPSKYNLNPCDEGGQYDIRAPVGATCAGYSHFVNVIEPNVGVYGMRCCQNSADCDVGQSTFGVEVIFGSQSDFSGPRPDGPIPASLGCVNGQLPGGNPTAPASALTSPTLSPTATSASATSAAAVTTPTTLASSSSAPAPSKTTAAATSDSAASRKAAVVVTAVLATALGLLFA
ncbi:hypothetical protein BGZ99_008409 [Dissophora globulifera]|uniref:Uncharacterized protein n=1 Tax=Dissophora globulifera TaxID=979702 RepID=A0A9P6UZ07_9FUNG|nr:hypothetical protein BGZ99_008409 [Dissophora globulifera]